MILNELYASIYQYIVTHLDRYVQAAQIHLAICLATLLISLAIGVPLGIYCAKRPSVSVWLMHVFNFLKIIPSLAVLIAVMPILGTGFWPALLALNLHAAPTILINTYIGFKNLDPFVIESARGMGLSKREILFKVEIPLAMPLILTGVRTCTVDVIATATLAAYIGAGGLGEFVIMGLGDLDVTVMLVGSLSIAVLSILADLILAGIQKRATRYLTA